MRLAADKETNDLLGKIAAALSETYPSEDAESPVCAYYKQFTDPVYCESIGIPVQDDDFFFHEGIRGMALRIHYYLGIGGDPAPEKFIEWRAAHFRRA
jgi:hypothetical protein